MTKYYMYTTKYGDRWDTIAVKFRGNTFDYDDIINANPQVAIKPMLDEGIEIRIPVKEDDTNTNNLPIWLKER